MSEPTFTTRQINGNWHMVRTENEEKTYPAASELHASVMVSLEMTDLNRKKAGLPPMKRK